MPPKRHLKRARRKTVSEARRVQALLGGLLILIALVAIGVGVWTRLRPLPAPAPPAAPDTVQVYLPSVSSQGELVYEPRPLSVKASPNPYADAIEYLLKNASGFPKNTRLLSAKREGNTLVLDFSKEFVEGFEGGSDDEAAVINALARTAGSFPDVERIRLLVEGKPIESLGGHIDTSEPIAVVRGN